MMAEALGQIALATGMTLLLTLAAGIIGIVLAAPLLPLAASRYRVLRFMYGAFVHVVRGVPPLV